jgi:hypothetical protein
MANQLATAGNAGTIATQDALGNQSIEVSASVQAEALAAQAEAEVRARWAIAQRCPRNWDQVRVSLLKECERPGFAEVARYTKPIGKDKTKWPTGPSIRFVEAALRAMQNVYCATTVISEDMRYRRIQVMVTDLEANVSWPKQITIEKTVERKDNRGRTVLFERVNSYGEPVYIVLATEDEMMTKENALASKALRVAGLRVIPGDLVEECMAMVDSTRMSGAKKDPAGERKKIVDAFLKVGVNPEMLVELLGHPLDLCQPSEISELRDIHASLKEGESKWSDVVAQARETVNAAPPRPVEQPTQAPPAAEQADPNSEVAMLKLMIEACATGKDLAQKVGPVMAKASPAVREACQSAYETKAKALRGGGK